MKKKLILSIGALGLVFAATPVISCSATSNNYYNVSKIVRANEISWSDKISNIPSAKHYTWNANNSTTVDQMVDRMNEKMNLYLPKTIAEISPYDFANFTLNFFLNNGGGTIGITSEYKSESQNILLQLEQPLVSMIRSFDGPPQITSNITRYNGTVLSGILSIGAKLATGSDPIQALTGFWNLFGDYGKVIFGTDSVLKLLTEVLAGESNPMLTAFVGLIEPFPASTLSSLPTFFGLFKTMAQEINTSTVDIKWATDNGIVDQLKNIDKIILDKLLHSTSPQ